MESRQRVQQQYSADGRGYDYERFHTRAGRLLSDYDVGLYRRLCPTYHPGMKVLEVGAGTGRFTVPTLEQGFELTATDINETMLNELHGRLADHGYGERCQVRTDDIFHLSAADGEYDYVFSIHVIPRFLNLEDQRAALSELCRVLKPGGRLLFNYRNSRSAYSLLHRGHMTRPSDIEGVLRGAGMRIVQQRGKHLLARRLLDCLPGWAGRVVSRVDRVTETWRPGVAWDVFVLAEKTG